jgi:hypothetical protein
MKSTIKSVIFFSACLLTIYCSSPTPQERTQDSLENDTSSYDISSQRDTVADSTDTSQAIDTTGTTP